MKKNLALIACILISVQLIAQSVASKIQQAFSAFEKDPQLTHAIASLYVIDAKTGAVVFEKNANYGLAPASTQKTFTSTAALELLGQDYRYKTEIGYDGKIEQGTLHGNFYLKGSGDPTLGSWRWKSTDPDSTVALFIRKMMATGIKKVDGYFVMDASQFDTKDIPGGWIWDDIGNYYGAGASAFNWKENQYDIDLKPGDRIGDSVKILIPGNNDVPGIVFRNELSTAAKGTGDNAYIYPSLDDGPSVIRGTTPQSTPMTISGAITNPDVIFPALVDLGFINRQKELFVSPVKPGRMPASVKPFFTYTSPALDSIVYWFLQKSINLYGECLLRTICAEQQGLGRTDSGVAILKRFWKDKGIDPDELNIYDGSGLSPLNRVTTHAEVMALKYAKTRPWFPAFYQALPEYNGMKMKSGTISDVKGYCGYHTAKDGKEYIFSILVNNYSGTTSGVVGKMFKVLDMLK